MIKRVEYNEEEQAKFLSEGDTVIEENPTMPPVVNPSQTAAANSEAVSASTAQTTHIPTSEKPVKGQVVVSAGSKIQGLVPTTIQEAWLFCSKMAESFSLPEAYYKKPKLPEGMKEDQLPNIMNIATSRAMQAMQLGMEVGLPPAQAIQSVLIMNGVGTIWGDSQLGLVLGSGRAEYVKEYTENAPMMLSDGKPNPLYTWVCETKRKGVSEPYFGRFTIADAIKAGLWGKTSSGGRASTWVTHPGRMGKYKARAFCLRDVYADVLKGLCHSREEMEGEMLDITPNGSAITPANSSTDLSKLLENKSPEVAPTISTVTIKEKEHVNV